MYAHDVLSIPCMCNRLLSFVLGDFGGEVLVTHAKVVLLSNDHQQVGLFVTATMG